MKDNKEVVFMDVDQYQLILDNAQVGWWKADFEERCYICSDYLISLLELDGPKISIVDFFLLIRGDYRDRIANEFAFFKGIGIYEQIFPIKTCYGYRFVRTKIYKREKASDGKLTVLGILQLIPFSEMEENRPVVNGQVDSVLRHLGSLSHALHSFIQTNDLHNRSIWLLRRFYFRSIRRGVYTLWNMRMRSRLAAHMRCVVRELSLSVRFCKTFRLLRYLGLHIKYGIYILS